MRKSRAFSHREHRENEKGSEKIFEANQFLAGKDAFAGPGESLPLEGIQLIEVFFCS